MIWVSDLPLCAPNYRGGSGGTGAGAGGGGGLKLQILGKNPQVHLIITRE